MTIDEKAGLATSTKVGIGADVMIILTMLSSFSYELGNLSIIVPPAYKPWVSGISLGSAAVLFFWKRFLELRSTQTK